MKNRWVWALAAGGGLLAVTALLLRAPGAPATTLPEAARAALPSPMPSPPPRPTVAVAAQPTALAPATMPPELKAVPTGLALSRPIRYAAIGASDTVGIGTADPARQNWTAQVAAQLPPDTVYERFARSGITLYEALDVEVPAAVTFKPNLVTVWLVVNDALRAVPLSVYQKELASLLDTLTSQTDAQVVLLNAPDISTLVAPDASEQTRIQMRSIAGAWNQAIAATAAPYGRRVLIVDLFAESQQAVAHPDWLSPDGFHPSATGYQEIATATVAALRQAGWVP
ncbi:MAG TPA: GDSL-type esterase/lipase family protein [Chloroflexia bacterium]|nr:GDSL-type esterase/lipase family protein [Chloroflexia bacterium]